MASVRPTDDDGDARTDLSSTPVATSLPRVSLADLVRAQQSEFSTGVAPAADGDWSGASERRADKFREWFERSQLELIDLYLGRCTPTGVALTRSGAAVPGRLPRLRGWTTRHPARLDVEIDLVTAGDAAGLVAKCERARVRADQLLSGTERERVLRVIYERFCELIRLVDQVASESAQWSTDSWFPPETEADDTEEKRELRRLRRELESEQRDVEVKQHQIDVQARAKEARQAAEVSVEQADALCSRAVRRRALMAYFLGMLAGVVLFTGVGIVLGQILAGVKIVGFDLERFLTTFIAGAVGAVVSVMTRMSGSEVAIDYETGRGYLALLGGFRPLIGAIFGVVLYFGIASGILQASVPRDPSEVFFFFAFISFLAGFSERWAKDTLVAGRNVVSAPQSK